jgi:signal transduction histidine kinase
MLVDFVANVSHELRTPLTSVLGFVETLEGPARNDPVARDPLTIMGEQARRMLRFVDDLPSLSRIEQSLHLQSTSTVDLISGRARPAMQIKSLHILCVSQIPSALRVGQTQIWRKFARCFEGIPYGSGSRKWRFFRVPNGFIPQFARLSHAPMRVEQLPRKYRLLCARRTCARHLDWSRFFQAIMLARVDYVIESL